MQYVFCYNARYRFLVNNVAKYSFVLLGINWKYNCHFLFRKDTWKLDLIVFLKSNYCRIIRPAEKGGNLDLIVSRNFLSPYCPFICIFSPPKTPLHPSTKNATFGAFTFPYPKTWFQPIQNSLFLEIPSKLKDIIQIESIHIYQMKIYVKSFPQR